MAVDNFNAGFLLASARRGVATSRAAQNLSLDDWEAIASEANESAHHHLVRVNALPRPG